MTNKRVKQLLQQKYGKGCMFKKAQIAARIEKMGGIRSYKVFVKQQRFTPKKIKELEKNLTLHHLVHQSEGGKTNEDNGAVVNELAHRYLHSLPRAQEEVINNMLRSYKLNIVEMSGQGAILGNDTLELTFPTEEELENDDDFLTIQLVDNTPEQDAWVREQKYNRARVKKETQRLIDAALAKLEQDDRDDR